MWTTLWENVQNLRRKSKSLDQLASVITGKVAECVEEAEVKYVEGTKGVCQREVKKLRAQRKCFEAERGTHTTFSALRNERFEAATNSMNEAEAALKKIMEDGIGAVLQLKEPVSSYQNTDLTDLREKVQSVADGLTELSGEDTAAQAMHYVCNSLSEEELIQFKDIEEGESDECDLQKMPKTLEKAGTEKTNAEEVAYKQLADKSKPLAEVAEHLLGAIKSSLGMMYRIMKAGTLKAAENKVETESVTAASAEQASAKAADALATAINQATVERNAADKKIAELNNSFAARLSNLEAAKEAVENKLLDCEAQKKSASAQLTDLRAESEAAQKASQNAESAAQEAAEAVTLAEGKKKDQQEEFEREQDELNRLREQLGALQKKDGAGVEMQKVSGAVDAQEKKLEVLAQANSENARTLKLQQALQREAEERQRDAKQKEEQQAAKREELQKAYDASQARTKWGIVFCICIVILGGGLVYWSETRERRASWEDLIESDDDEKVEQQMDALDDIFAKRMGD